jgi:hypothetical protein
MPNFSLRVLSTLTVCALLFPLHVADAASVNCPGTAVTTDREFQLTTSVAAVCLASAAGNLNGNSDAINALGYVTLDKSDDATTGALPGALTFTPPTSGLSGTFSITAPGYSSFVLALKSGQGQLNPDWVAFLLPAGILSGAWAILNGNQQLSHANLYGLPTPTPLPGALVLMGTALAGSYGIGRWRRRNARSLTAV